MLTSGFEGSITNLMFVSSAVPLRTRSLWQHRTSAGNGRGQWSGLMTSLTGSVYQTKISLFYELWTVTVYKHLYCCFLLVPSETLHRWHVLHIQQLVTASTVQWDFKWVCQPTFVPCWLTSLHCLTQCPQNTLKCQQLYVQFIVPVSETDRVNRLRDSKDSAEFSTLTPTHRYQSAVSHLQ